MRLIKEIKKGDIFLVLLLIIICVLWFIPGDTGDKLKAEIFLEGECVEARILTEIKEDEKIKIAGCEILLQKDGVTFLHSECPDKLCQKRGKMTASGDVMACVPQKVVVVLSSQKEPDFDSVAY